MTLTAHVRDESKKAEALRKEGFVPAVVYGHGEENVHLVVPEKDFSRVFKEAGESTVVILEVDKAKYSVLIQDVQRDRITGRPLHVDFRSVKADEKISAHVTITFIDESLAIKTHIGVLTKAMTEIEVEALPADLPHDIKVSLAPLNVVGDAVHVGDIVFPKGVKPCVEEESVIVSVSELAKEEVVVAPETSVSDIKVETEEKKEERAEQKKEQES